jgi:hypothetical protein
MADAINRRRWSVGQKKRGKGAHQGVPRHEKPACVKALLAPSHRHIIHNTKRAMRLRAEKVRSAKGVDGCWRRPVVLSWKAYGEVGMCAARMAGGSLKARNEAMRAL